MKSALIIKTYLWFYNIIRNYGPLTLNQINEMWMADTRLSEGKPMIRQTFQRYRLDVEDVFGVSICCDNENRYYIKNRRLKEADDKASLLSLAEKNTLTEMMDYRHRIILEPKFSVNIYFDIILDSMCKNVMVEFDYQQDDAPMMSHQLVEPYCVKQYGADWYLMGRRNDGSFGAFALARLKKLRLTDRKFKLKYEECVKLCEDIEDFFEVQ